MTTTTATAPDLTLPTVGGRYHFLLRRLHSLTGIVFGGYLVVHLIINATLLQGRAPSDVYQGQVNKIHSLPFLWAIEWLFIYLPILYHTVYGIWITLTGQPNVGRYGYAKNWYYTLQRLSAIIIVLFLAFHVLSLKYHAFGMHFAFDPENATRTVASHLQVSPVLGYVVYPIGILASCYHLANGFWTAAITWGLTVSAASQRKWGFACAGLFVLVLFCGMGALYAGLRIDPNALPPVGH